MDGLSAAVGVITVVQISGQVFDLCRTYYSEVRDAKKDIEHLRDEMKSLKEVSTKVASNFTLHNLSILIPSCLPPREHARTLVSCTSSSIYVLRFG